MPMPRNKPPASFKSPYPLKGSKLRTISTFEYVSEWLHLGRHIRAVQMRNGARDALYVVMQDYTVRFKFAHVKEDSANYGWQYITVPAGMLTDLSSVPQLLWNIVGPVGPHLEASVVHDFLYIAWQDLPGRGALEDDWEFADNILLAGMGAAGVDKKQRSLIYSSVRQWGWDAYKGVNAPPRYVDVPV